MANNIEINGKKIVVEGNKTIIEVADEQGVYIPRFCYHKKLSVAANCRMCLVEVQGGRKPMPACATPVADGMKIFTKSSTALHSQKAVLEFLLINHPLDCPICDQGGQCELQDLAVGFGSDASEYNQTKRAVASDNLGPLIATEMTRCIHCTRCVRFGEEVAGMRELGATDRGEHMEIGTYIKKTVQSEVSGNVIELCPVGALLSKPFLYRARAWEVEEHPSIAVHDCLGSNIAAHTRRKQLMRVVPRENETINEVWLSDRDRFSYLGVNSKDRAKVPMIKKSGKWIEASWEEALTFAVDGLKNILGKDGAAQLGALASPSSTLEELYLLQKIMRGLGSHNIDHRVRQTDFSDQMHLPPYLSSDISIKAIEEQDAILMIGAYIRHEQPLAALRVRKAVQKGAAAMAINVLDLPFNFDVKHQLTSSPSTFVGSLRSVLHALVKGRQVPDQIARLVHDAELTEQAGAIAQELTAAKQAVVMLGAFAHHHPEAAKVRLLAAAIAELSGAKMMFLTDGANSAGAYIAGCVPHRGACARALLDEKKQPLKNAGLDAQAMLSAQLKAYVLMGLEPELDCANSALALKALKQAEFVVSLNAYDTDAMREYANVMLPIASFAETSGTYVNVEGLWQTVQAVIPAQYESRPAWKLLRVLGNLLELDAFAYNSSADVHKELRKAHESHASFKPSIDVWRLCADHVTFDSRVQKAGALQRIAQVPIYASDSVVRRAEPLQEVFGDAHVAVQIHSETAKAFALEAKQTICVEQAGQKVTLPLRINDQVPPACALVYSGIAQTMGLGDAFGDIMLKGS